MSLALGYMIEVFTNLTCILMLSFDMFCYDHWRAITTISSHIPNKHCHHKLRVVWYHIMSALEEKSTQERGAVFIHYDIGSSSSSSSSSSNATDQCGGKEAVGGFQTTMDFLQHSFLVTESLPIRLVAMHMCYDNRRFQGFRALFNVLERSKRVRFRFHCGTYSTDSD